METEYLSTDSEELRLMGKKAQIKGTGRANVQVAKAANAVAVKSNGAAQLPAVQSPRAQPRATRPPAAQSEKTTIQIIEVPTVDEHSAEIVAYGRFPCWTRYCADQVPLPFIIGNDTTYDDKGTDSVQISYNTS